MIDGKVERLRNNGQSNCFALLHSIIFLCIIGMSIDINNQLLNFISKLSLHCLFEHSDIFIFCLIIFPHQFPMLHNQLPTSHPTPNLSSPLFASFSSSNQPNYQKHLIYLRELNKRSCKVLISEWISVQELATIIHKELGIKSCDQVVTLRGRTLQIENNLEILKISDGSIVHIGTKSSICQQNQIIEVNFQWYEGGSKIDWINLSVYADQKLSSVIFSEKCIPNQFNRQTMNKEYDIEVYQNGQKIKIQSTFFNLKIHNQSYFIVIITTRSQTIPIQHPKQHQSPSITITIPKTTNNNHDTSNNSNHDASSIQCDYYEPKLISPNFKKQSKTSHIYKSSRSPNDKGTAKWESDSSSSYNTRERLKAIQIRKDSLIKKSLSDEESSMKISNPSSDNNDSLSKINIFNKNQLKNDIRRLFQSEKFHNSTEVQKLEPPKIMTDDFLDEIQQLQFGEIDADHSPIQNEDKNQLSLKMPMQLGKGLMQSLGSPGRREWSTDMIPTRDIEIDLDEDDEEIEDF